MALSAYSLKNKILTQMADVGFDTDTAGKDEMSWQNNFAQAIAIAIVEEITENAQCSGTDTHGDGHNEVKII